MGLRLDSSTSRDMSTTTTPVGAPDGQVQDLGDGGHPLPAPDLFFDTDFTTPETAPPR